MCVIENNVETDNNDIEMNCKVQYGDGGDRGEWNSNKRNIVQQVASDLNEVVLGICRGLDPMILVYKNVKVVLGLTR